jgi:hypothetical protein
MTLFHYMTDDRLVDIGSSYFDGAISMSDGSRTVMSPGDWVMINAADGASLFVVPGAKHVDIDNRNTRTRVSCCLTIPDTA